MPKKTDQATKKTSTKWTAKMVEQAVEETIGMMLSDSALIKSCLPPGMPRQLVNKAVLKVVGMLITGIRTIEIERRILLRMDRTETLKSLTRQELMELFAERLPPDPVNDPIVTMPQEVTAYGPDKIITEQSDESKTVVKKTRILMWNFPPKCEQAVEEVFKRSFYRELELVFKEGKHCKVMPPSCSWCIAMQNHTPGSDRQSLHDQYKQKHVLFATGAKDALKKINDINSIISQLR